MTRTTPARKVGKLGKIRDLDLLTAPLDATCLVEANAGTGKTYAITALYLRLLLEQGLSVDQILVVTFTVAATGELRGRIRQRLREALLATRDENAGDDPFLTKLLARCGREKAAAILRQAISCFDTAQIFTIHGFCQRVLQENAFETGAPFGIELATDLSDLVEESARDFWRRRMVEASPMFLRHVLADSGPGHYASLAWRCLNHPDLLVDAPGTEAPMDREEREFTATCARAKAAWEAEMERILGLLSSSDVLNKRSYTPERIAARGREMYAFLSDGQWEVKLPECVAFFARRAIAKATKKGQTAPSHPFFDLCDALLDLAERLGASYARRLRALDAEFAARLPDDLAARKALHRSQSFGDLLTRFRDALRSGRGGALVEAVRNRLRAALVDEFQDTDLVQFAIFGSLFKVPGRALYLIGDPKQAIYSFRGADIHAYLKATDAADHVFTIRSNWRSEPELTQAVNRLFTAHPTPFVLPEIAYAPSDSPKKEWPRLRVRGEAAHLHVWHVANPKSLEKPVAKGAWREEVTRAVAREVARLLRLSARGRASLDDRPLAPGDFAVLVQSHREGDQARAALAALGIPSVAAAQRSVFASDEARHLQRVLAAAADPGDAGAVRRALATPLFALDAPALELLARDDAAWEEWLARFADFRDTLEGAGVVALLERLLARDDTRARIVASPDGERAITNIVHLMELLHAQERAAGLSPRGLCAWLGHCIARAEEEGTPEEHLLRLESDDATVQIVTIHASKGLQYPVVFVPFLLREAKVREGDVVPDGDERRLLLDPAADAARTAVAEREQMAESLRLAYVALTRARNRCYLAWGKANTHGASALDYLLLGRDGKTPTDFLTTLKERHAGLTHAQVGAFLEGLAEGCPHIAVSELPEEPGEDVSALLAARGGRIDPAALACRRAERRVVRARRVGSFTQLSSMAHNEPDASLPAGTGELASPIRDLPAGARTGTMLHELFERLDFMAEQGEVERLAGETLARHGFAPEWRDGVARMARNVVETELEEGVRLCDVPMHERVCELEFHFPVSGLTPAALARAYASLELPALPGGIPERIGRLSFAPLAGYMRGFMDLVFRHQGRYYLLDWKSNRLGPSAEDYRGERLGRAMAANSYFLQFHIYLVALCRHLARRVPGFDPGSDLGGVAYVFLRGVDPANGPGCGIFFDRPGPGAIAALDAALTGRPS